MPTLAMAAAVLISQQVAAAALPLRRPHVLMVLQDDYGWFDFHGEPLARFHPSLTALASEGITLTNHLVHYHCSPTRRSFLSGRLPIHHGEQLSGVATDDLDLRWTLVSGKLKRAGYSTHWVGKGHTGYMSMAHLPTNRGFDSFVGFLSGSQSYTSADRWQNEGPLNDTTYSSDLYGGYALDIVRRHTADEGPLFIYLPWQVGADEPTAAPPPPPHHSLPPWCSLALSAMDLEGPFQLHLLSQVICLLRPGALLLRSAVRTNRRCTPPTTRSLASTASPAFRRTPACTRACSTSPTSTLGSSPPS
jgi:arylsulfatase A-like enzyme